jgi:hypothetical protein
MPQIFLERGFIRISLTPEEARNYGFLSSQPHSAIMQIEHDGNLVLAFSSELLQPGFKGRSVLVWIPPLPTSHESVASPAASITKPAAQPSSFTVPLDDTTLPTIFSRTARISKTPPSI